MFFFSTCRLPAAAVCAAPAETPSLEHIPAAPFSALAASAASAAAAPAHQNVEVY